MCLGIPGQVIGPIEGYGGQLALVDVAGVQRKINIGLLDDGPLAPGSWVLIHMGFALERVDPGGAERAMSGLELMGRPREPGEGLPPASQQRQALPDVYEGRRTP
jgi:hydrogenase expression/formation protein HypC